MLDAPNVPSEGAQGTLNQQLTPYNYVGQDVTVGGVENITVPAGNFSAFKVTAQVDVATMMPNWPRFILHIIKPAVPKDTLYFESTAPFRLLKQEGPIYIGGPKSRRSSSVSTPLERRRSPRSLPYQHPH